MSARAIAAILVGLTVLSVAPADAAPASDRRSGRAALGGEAHVDARDDYFLPSAVETGPGGTVVWDFTGDRTHTVTDATGMSLFDSGLVAPDGTSFSYAFAAAGTYRYVCTLHETMRGRVWVMVEVSKDEQPYGRPFVITWATGGAVSGSVFDVQLRRPGKRWRPWRTGVTEPDGELAPRHAGTFRVRARLRGPAGMTEWSPGARFVAT